MSPSVSVNMILFWFISMYLQKWQLKKFAYFRKLNELSKVIQFFFLTEKKKKVSNSFTALKIF